MYKPCSFNRKEYLENAESFEPGEFLCTQNELTEFGDDSEDLEEDLAALREQVKRAKDLSFKGHRISQRIEGDLKRIMNSAWLTLFEFSEEKEKENK